MAASVTYQIKGKYDNKAVKQAKTDLTDLGKSIKGLGVAAWTKLSTELISGLTKAVDGSADSFIQQNSAYKRLDASIKASNKDFTDLIKYQNKLSKNNFFDGDTLNNVQAMAINMGLNQKQVIAVMDAAEELTTAGIMPLDQAVKSLSLSYSGNISMLSKYIPQMKELSKEQLKNGEAIKIVKDNYDGIADAMSQTFEGRNTQFKNATGDLKNSVGGIIESLKYIQQGKWLEPINNLTEWIETNRETILKGIIAIPSIAKEVLNLINSMIKTTLSPSNFGTIFKDISKIALTSVKALCNSMLSLFNVFYAELGMMTTTFLGKSGMFRKIDAWAGAVVNNLNSKIFGWIINLDQSIRSLGEPWTTIFGMVVDQTPIGFMRRMLSDSEGNLRRWNEDENWEGYNGYTPSSSVFDTAFNDFEKTFVKEFNTLKPLLSEFGVDLDGIYSKNLGDFGKTVKEIIEKTELPEDLKNALTKLAVTTSDNNESSSDSEYDFSKLLDGFTITKDALITKIMDLVTSIQNVTAILNPWTTILESMFDIVAPVVNEVLAPIVGALKIIGTTLGQVLIPLITTLTPRIKMLGEIFTWLYNWVILPIGNTLIVMFIGFKNFITGLINGLISLINLLPWMNIEQLAYDDINSNLLQEIKPTDLTAVGSVSTSTSGSSASYTAARDIYVNINFEHSFVNGDATEIAIMLKDEIARAERLGY